MKLLTKAIVNRLNKSPLYSTEKQNVVPVIVKFFTPSSNWTWFAVEGEEVKDEFGVGTGDYEFFGLVEGHERELGYFRLSELQSIKCPPFGLGVERDKFFDHMVLDKINNTVRSASAIGVQS
jgi:hypothetical protein